MITKTNNCPVPKRIKEARLKLEIPQKQLGIAAGMDEAVASSRVNQYETGRHTPDFTTARLIAKVLKVPTAYLYESNDRLAELILVIGRMSKQEQNTLLEMLKSRP